MSCLLNLFTLLMSDFALIDNYVCVFCVVMDNLCIHAVFALSIAAIAVAGLFAILCIIFIVVVIVKLKGITVFSLLITSAKEDT